MVVTTSGGTGEKIKELAEELKKLKEQADRIKDGKEVGEAAAAAIDAASKQNPDPIEVLEATGKVMQLVEKVPGLEAASALSFYGKLVVEVAGTLKELPLTPYDRAIDKAYSETGSVADATKAADALLPDTPAADRQRGIDRVRVRHLKRTTPQPKKPWWHGWLPWNWLSSDASYAPAAAGGATLAAAGGVFATVLLFGGCAGAANSNASPALDRANMVTVQPPKTHDGGCYWPVRPGTCLDGGCATAACQAHDQCVPQSEIDRCGQNGNCGPITSPPCPNGGPAEIPYPSPSPAPVPHSVPQAPDQPAPTIASHQAAPASASQSAPAESQTQAQMHATNPGQPTTQGGMNGRS